MLSPDSVQVPVPALVNASAPAPMTPDTNPLPVPPKVRVEATLSTAPKSEMLPLLATMLLLPVNVIAPL